MREKRGKEKMEIKMMNVEDLIPYINNPRRNENAIDKVASSIKEFGFKVPIVIDKDKVVVTGHTRLLASKKLGLEQVPCVVADDLSKAQIKAFRLADNKVSEFSTWDMELLKVELEELEELNFEVSDLGFEFMSIDQLDIPTFDDFDDEEEDEEEEEETSSEGIIQYNIIFNNKEEQETWHEFIKFLRENYEGETISERLTEYIRGVL